MSTEREPLPYPHRTPDGKTAPCQRPETTRDISDLTGELNCPGCTAWIFALAIEDERIIARTTSEERVPLRQLIREEFDDFDPMRVLFERALAERGAA